MTLKNGEDITRRHFLKISAATTACLSVAPFFNCSGPGVRAPVKRNLGKINFEVTTLGLGGQASIQWTPSNVDPVKIIVKAFELGVNYFDTSNLYGPSQLNFGKAFRELNLVPGQPGYNEKKRRSIFLTSKTHLRWAKEGVSREGVSNWTQGPEGSGVIDDLKRTLSQIFGDGEGYYPSGAYIDMILTHNLNTMQEIDALYEGLEDPDPQADQIGALVALRDYRDGTNYTGLNPEEENLVRHIGFSGHHSPPVMMEMIQRDSDNILDAMLVAMNANDRLNFNMQHNAIPIASAKNMGIIAMKVFADGAMYTKEANWSRDPNHVVRTIGSPSLPSRPLVEYALTTPGIHTAIIGIGQINEDPQHCQLDQNLSAAQILPEELTPSDRENVEKMAGLVKSGETNYFQLPARPLSPPRKPAVDQEMRDDQRLVNLTWHTAYAAGEPVQYYEVWRDSQKIARVKHFPQTTHVPFAFEDMLSDRSTHTYKLTAVDRSGNSASTEDIILPATG